jgi:hypothetical protein
MIIVNIKGGLGNQMFQYAIGFALAKKKKTKLLLDVRELEEFNSVLPKGYIKRNFSLGIFGIKLEFSSKKDHIKVFQFNKKYKYRNIIAFFLDKLNFYIFRQRKRSFEKRFYNLKGTTWYLDGYWQSDKYFINYKKEILNVFNFNSLKNLEFNKNFIKDISKKKTICVNVRRTDFIGHPEHHTLDIKYYKKAIETFKKLIGNDFEIYVFSDDLQWCKKNFTFFDRTNFVEHSYAGKNFYNYLYLMTNFRNFVIPNSTFAWWAAWLCQFNDKKIIAPKKWSNSYDNSKIDIIPNSWIKI